MVLRRSSRMATRSPAAKLGPASPGPGTKRRGSPTTSKDRGDESGGQPETPHKKIKLDPEIEVLMEKVESEEISDNVSDAGTYASTKSTTNTPSRPSYQGGYNALKTFNGQVYKGMAVGGSHTWNYDPGIWTETKTEPDLWHIDYSTKKRRAKNAPRGSGAPVGTEYHWLIVAHQVVRKVDANTYETHLYGDKYKLAHKGSEASSWSVGTVKGQRDREIALLKDAIRRIEGLPPVTTGEKVKVERHEKGQQSLDKLFGKKTPDPKNGSPQEKVVRDAEDVENDPVK